MTLYPQNKIESYKMEHDDCAGKEGESCRQHWRTILSLNNETCTLDGDYRLNFTLGCGEDVKDCPLSAKDRQSFVDYKLKSEDFCSEISIDSGLVGIIKIYDSSSFTDENRLFLVDSTAYFLVRINSDLNPGSNPDKYNENDDSLSIKFTSIKLVALYFRASTNNTPNRIYPVEQGDNLDTRVQEITTKDGQALNKNELAFQLYFSQKLASDLKKNSKIDFTISAEIEVTFFDERDTNSTETSKRFVLDGSSEKTSLDTKATLDNSDREDDGDNGIIFLASMILLLFTLLL
jgi:hypothetical protein